MIIPFFIFNYKMCVHYWNLETQLFRKIGIDLNQMDLSIYIRNHKIFLANYIPTTVLTTRIHFNYMKV